MEEILCIQDLEVAFMQYESRSTKKTLLPVISKLNVRVCEGEVVAIVGSSGSGKSLLAHAIFGLLPKNATVRGKIQFQGQTLTEDEMVRLRGKELALVPQGVSYLDPRMKVGSQITGGKKDATSLQKMRSLCERYGLSRSVEGQYPFELSGGMARRVMLMTALMSNPRLVVADEPTPGLDLELAKQALTDFRKFADEGNGVLLITHDLELALTVADRVVVFYAGTTVEDALTKDFKDEQLLRHPYTKAFYRALPSKGFEAWPGTQPYVKDMPKGCPFAPRCPYKEEACSGDVPMYEVRGGRVRCVRYKDMVEK